MIFDRTQEDVDKAVSIRENKIKKFLPLDSSDIDSLERGMMTINTLNRIESKQEELKSLLNDMGYWNIPIINKAWKRIDIFNVDDFQRIIDNTNILRDAFFTYRETPNTPPISYHFNDINSLEKIHYDLDVDRMIKDVKSLYKKCGTFKCGGLI